MTIVNSLTINNNRNMITYEPFWRTIKQKKVSTYLLIKEYGISSATIDRLRKNEGISTAKIDDLCKILDCKVEDIICYVPDAQAGQGD